MKEPSPTTNPTTTPTSHPAHVVRFIVLGLTSVACIIAGVFLEETHPPLAALLLCAGVALAILNPRLP